MQGESMKKIILFAVACAALVACSVKEEFQESVTLHATVDLNSTSESSSTKVVPVDLSQPVVDFRWEEGDQVRLTSGGSSTIFTLAPGTISVDGKSADFKGTPLADMSSFSVEYNFAYSASGSKETTQTVAYLSNSFKPFISGTGSNNSFTLNNFRPVLKLSIKGNGKIGRIEYFKEDAGVLTVLDCSTGVQLAPTSATTFYLPLSEDAAIGASGKEYVKFYDESSTLIRSKKLPNLGTNAGNIIAMPTLEFVQGLCFTAQEDGATVGMTVVGTGLTPNLEYSRDATYYQAWNGSAITLESAGDKVYFKAGDGGNTTFFFPGMIIPFYIPAANAYFTTTKKIKLSGNIMYLLNGDTPATDLSSDNNYCFKELFKNSTITDASELVMPGGTLSCNCFESCFEGCANLSAAPALPSTALASSCYTSMFKDCGNLTSAPELAAGVVPNDCYHGMFQNCSSLSSAPDLPAATASDHCYDMMFKGCSSLVSAPAISATTMALASCYGMFAGCTSLSAAPALSATAIAKGCYYEMFDGCSSLANAPALPATSLFEDCYCSMFRNCTNLTSTPVLNAPTLATGCYKQLFSGCSSITTVTMLATDVSADSCLSSWLGGSGTLTVATGMSGNTTIQNNSVGWTIQETTE